MFISTLLEPTGNQDSSDAGKSGLEGQEQNTWRERWGKADRLPLYIISGSG